MKGRSPLWGGQACGCGCSISGVDGVSVFSLYLTRMATAGPLTENISAETTGSHSDYWSHMERVSTFKKAEHHHKLTPAQQELMQCEPAPFACRMIAWSSPRA